MNKMKIGIMGVACLLAGSQVLPYAGEFRGPEPMRSGSTHFPFEEESHHDGDWKVDSWLGFYSRSAHQAYDEHGTTKSPLSVLFFGKADFLGQEAFANASVTVARNPLLNFSTISPRFTYNENGAVFGLSMERRCDFDEHATMGVRFSMPFKEIKVERDSFAGTLAESLSDFVQFRVETFNNTTIADNFAFNLAFLSALEQAPGQKLVTYGTSTANMTIANVNVTTNNAVNGNAVGPVHVIGRSDGTMPPSSVEFGAVDTDAAAGTLLDAQGDNVANNGRGRFDVFANVDYSGSNPQLAGNSASQRNLFVVPTINTNGGAGNNAQATDAQTIKSAVNAILKTIDSNVETFFIDNNISFDSQRTVGVGDLDIEVFARYHMSDRAFWEATMRVGAPTAKDIADPKLLLKMPTANNSHPELGFGFTLGFSMFDWLCVALNPRYNFAFRSTEKRATAFTGATIKNIGETVDARVRWDYFVNDLSLTWFHPHNHNLGGTFGYLLEVKRKDKISFKDTTATDLAGNASQTLSAAVLADKTDRISHKLRGELFHRWEGFELVAGWNTTVAGRYAARFTDFYGGVNISF